jgi:hypothetical protein
MNIKEKFLELTSKTYPHGTEGDLFPILFSTVDGLQVDEFGNLFIQIGQSDVMFTSHLDTATSALSVVNHVFEGDIIKTDGKSILGADDKAGVTIMLNMIKNEIPGLYYFFLGEEVGCIGSKKVAGVQKENKIEGINKVISFDRRGTNSVITYQSSQRCCSDTFGSALSEQLNLADSTFKYENDPTGILTDSVQFIKIYSECTNISVGYQSEHTFRESQDLYHLNKLALACLDVKWEELPTKRVPGIRESKWDKNSYSETEYDDYYGYGWGSSRDLDDEDYYTSRGRRKTRRGNIKNSQNWSNGRTFYDDGSGLVEIQSNKGVFDVFRDKFLTTDLTREELELVKEQYFDMSNPLDKKSYDKLSSIL